LTALSVLSPSTKLTRGGRKKKMRRRRKKKKEKEARERGQQPESQHRK